MPLLPSTIERESDRNPAGGCRLQFARVQDISTFPDEVNGVLAAPIALVSGAQWITVHGPQFTQEFSEEWLLEGGDQLAQASLGFVISKDRPQLLAGLYRLKPGRYVVLHHDHNGTVKCIGTKDEPAQLRIEKLAHGRQPGADRNAYEGLVSLRRRTACPFYGATPPSPVPHSCPTVQEQLAELNATQIAVILSELDLTEAVQAQICQTLCAMLDAAIVVGDEADASAVVACLSPEQAAVLLEALGGSGGPCPSLCELLDEAIILGGSPTFTGVAATLNGQSGTIPATGTTNGKPSGSTTDWPGTDFAEFLWNGSAWMVSDGFGTWTSTEDVATPGEVTTWSGADPLPTVTDEFSGGDDVSAITDCLNEEQAAALAAALGATAGGTVRIRNSADDATLDEVAAPGDYVIPGIRIPYVDADGDAQYFVVYPAAVAGSELTVTEPGGGVPPVPRFAVRTTDAGTVVGYCDIMGPALNLPQSRIKYKDADDASEVSAPHNTVFEDGTLRPDYEVPRRELVLTGGTGLGRYVSVGELIGNTVPTIPQRIIITWEAGMADSIGVVLPAEMQGVAFSFVSETVSHGTITVSVNNGGSFAAAPFTPGTQKVIFRRTTTTNEGSALFTTA